jgi:hypothetical protein
MILEGQFAAMNDVDRSDGVIRTSTGPHAISLLAEIAGPVSANRLPSTGRPASTNRSASRRGLRAVTCGVLLGAMLFSTGAWAQTSLLPNSPVGAGNIATGRRNGSTGAPEKPAIPAPDAIPGAKAREPAAPAIRGANDMAPNDALFDAINRGDIATARDALNRGADLNAVNVLGMTPMELSVDLGRNDISFLLLSMRGEDSGRGSRSVGRDTPAPPPTAKTVASAKPPRVTASGKPSRGQAKLIQEAAKPVATPKLFANDGGAPLPNAGFLGFDPRSASN